MRTKTSSLRDLEGCTKIKPSESKFNRRGVNALPIYFCYIKETVNNH